MKYRDHRQLCDYELDVTVRGEERRATVRNVSERGARLAGLRALSPGDRLTLDLRLAQAHAEVVWSRADLVGIRFDRPLTRQEITMIRGTAEGALSFRNGAGYTRFREL